MDDLDSLLENLHSGEGEVVSSGKFTLDLRKAREKLRQYQLSEPCFYLMKIVQAVVSGGAKRIDIHLGRTRVRLLAQMPNSGIFKEAQSLIEHLGDPQGMEPGPLRHLAIGLNSSWSVEPETVEWKFWSSESYGGWNLKIGADEMEVTDLTERPGKIEIPMGADVVEFQLTRQKNLISVVKGAAAEHVGVVHRCAFCPVPMYLDSRRLLGQWSPAENMREGWSGYPYYVAERFVGPDTGPSTFRICAPPWADLNLADDQMVNSTRADIKEDQRVQTYSYQLKDLPEVRADTIVCRLAVALPVAVAGRARLVLVKDGVTLEPVELGLGMQQTGVQAIMAAEDIKTDLSEFRAVEDETLKKCEIAVRSELHELLVKVEPLEPALPYRLPTGNSAPMYVGGCVGCLFGSIPGMLLFGWLAQRFFGNSDTSQKTAAAREFRTVAKNRLKELRKRVAPLPVNIPR